MLETKDDTPRGDFDGFVRFARNDIKSGFLVFLIALPLCLGISLASGFPPLAGVFTAIIGGLLTTFISNSELTIKGPAAGLIVIVIGCISEFGGDGAMGGFSNADHAAYRAALAIAVVAAVLQILFGLFRGGVLGDFFPLSAVHGMLAAIGVIIILKQIPVALGVSAKGEPLELLREIPKFVMEANPAVASIGVVSLLIMFLWPIAGKGVGLLKAIPSPVIVLCVAIPMGMAMDLLHSHSYMLQGHQYQLGEQFLVAMPNHMFGMFEEITFPDFTALQRPMAWKWVLMFFIIGSLESVLSAKAVDLLDPWRRKTNLNRDMLAVGTGNLCAAMVGGLPMISEIVRSRANIDNGARTRFADMWHSIFLLACVALLPTMLHRIPLASLAAMLVYTGYRLAHPREFINAYRVGREQLLIFVITLFSVLATDLLVGIAIGIIAKMVIHVMNGVPLSSLFKPYLEIEPQDEHTSLIRAHYSAVFSNWLPFRRQLEHLGMVQRQNIILDLSNTKLVDHSVMEKLHELQRDFDEEGLSLSIVGLESLEPVGAHEFAARRSTLAEMRRVTVVAEKSLEETLEDQFIQLGASGFSSVDCRGIGQHDIQQGQTTPQGDAYVRIELIVTPEVAQKVLSHMKQYILHQHRAIVCVESVGVIRRDHFLSPAALDDSNLLPSTH